MHYVWHRYDLRHRFDLNSATSRLEYYVWYLYEYIGQSGFDAPIDQATALNDLNRRIDCFGPLTTFWHTVWRQHFRTSPGFNIYQEQGYFHYLTQIVMHEAPRRRVPAVLLPIDLLSQLHDAQPGLQNPFVSRAMYSIWLRSEFYRDTYQDIQSPAVRDAYAFDYICQALTDESPPARLAPELVRQWSRSLSARCPGLTKFGLLLASRSSRFGEALRRRPMTATTAAAIQSWLITEVAPSHPRAAAFLRTAPAHPPLPDSRPAAQPVVAAPAVAKPADAIDVLVIGPAGAASGLGAGTRRTISALRKTGAVVRVLSSTYGNPSVMDCDTSPDIAYRGERPNAIVWHFNGEYLPDVMASTPDLAQSGAYNIGYPFWETEVMPKAHSLMCELVDELWVPSAFCAKTYAASGRPVINVGSSVELAQVGQFLPRAALDLPEDAFVVMFSFDAHSVMQRKNPAGVVRAFRKAFPLGHENAILILKTQNFATAHWGNVDGRGRELMELCGADPRVRFIDRTMPLLELYSYKQACDCYMSLHRSEGYGYGPAEAMALGKPVIMTNYSGNLEFATDENCLLVDGPLVHLHPGEYLYWRPEMVWCEPDIDDAAAKLRLLFEQPDLASSLGQRAALTINRDHGVDAMAARCAQRLRDLHILH